MKKVLVVDDEKFIRLGIKTMLERKPESHYEITLCSNGVEALELINNEKFDIVITDIRMPEMDGITFIQNIQNKAFKPAILILSGYDDFDYAVEALRCGAKNYLLKPIQREDLYASFDKVESEIDKSYELADRESLISSNIEDFIEDELNYIFLKENISENEIISIGNRIQLNILNEEYYLGLLVKPDMGINSKTYNLKNEINSKLEEYRVNAKDRHIIIFDNDFGLVIIANDFGVFTYIQEKYAKDNFFRLNIGVSCKAFNIVEIRKTFNQALDALKYRIFSYNYGTTLVSYSSVSEKKKDYIIPLDSIEKLGNMIGTDREKEIEKSISELLNENKIRELNISYFEIINKKINEVILDKVKVKFTFEDENVLMKFERFNNIYNFKSFKEYFHELKEFIVYISEYIRTINEIYGDRKNIDRAIEYINNNYHKDLNLAIVSNVVSLNYSYFSQLFKEQTGENFVSYLKKLRISRAKDLLMSDEYKIYEIAKKVGYEDSKRFAKIFRSITGVSPVEYRDSKMHGNI